MHGERLDFKLDAHLNQTVRQAVLKEIHHFQLLTVVAPFDVACTYPGMHDHTVYAFQVEYYAMSCKAQLLSGAIKNWSGATFGHS